MHKILKKAAAVAALGSVLTLTGCSMKLPFTEKMPDFDTAYTVCAEIQSSRLNAKADVTRVAASDWQFEFTEPKQLCGVVMSFGKSGLSASLGGLSFCADDNSQYAMLPEIISKSVDALSTLSTDNLVKENGIIVAELAFDGERVTITMDEKTGDLISLKCPNYQLAVTFTEQKPYTAVLPDEGGLITSDSVTQ